MSLTWRISLRGETSDQPEDYLSTALGVIFPDDVTNQHGDAEHSLSYASPHLPRPLLIDLADPQREDDRELFSHYLWNASLLLAELIEADSLGVPLEQPRGDDHRRRLSFDVKGLETLELGAGTALPSIMAGLLGARRVVVTDYPAEPVLRTLRTNVARNIQPPLSPSPELTTPTSSIVVEGHSWGEVSDSSSSRHAFDRVMVADCLWMPWQHANLHRSIAFFLRRAPGARCWVVAGFHTGREKMRGFYARDALREVGLEVESIWERDCNGDERPWDADREDDVTVRKRWLVVASLKWISTEVE